MVASLTRRSATLAAVALIGVIAACSPDDDGTTADPTPPETASAGASSGAPSTTEPTSPNRRPEEAPVDTSEFNQGPIPTGIHEIDEGRLPPEPDDTAPVPERIAWDALKEVSEFAGMVDPGATSDCPDVDPENDTSVTCTVAFLGEEYAYKVTDIEFRSTGLTDGENESGLVTYHTELPAGPMVREVLEADLRLHFETEYTVCDMEEHMRLDMASSQGRSSIGGRVFGTGVECRAIDVNSGEVITVELEMHNWGSPVRPEETM